MQNKELLKSIPYLNEIREIASQSGADIWLVGGAVRDFLLHGASGIYDFDFCLSHDTLIFVKKITRILKAKWIVLDDKQQSYRVIVRHKDKIYTYDFSALRAKDIKGDLALRDFTINALAIDIADKHSAIIDVTNGLKHLRAGKLEVSYEKVFRDDPLRILRTFSMMARFGFKPTNGILELIRLDAKRLRRISGERIREEILKIFSSENVYKIICLMDRLLVLDVLFPYITESRGLEQGIYHHLPVWAHSMETLKQFERLLNSKRVQHDSDLKIYLNDVFAANRPISTYIKIACLLHDIGKPRAMRKVNNRTKFHTHEKIGRDLAERMLTKLKFSVKERDLIQKLIFWHLRPGYLADQKEPTDRAVYRFFHDTADYGIAVILVSLSDWRATCGPAIDKVKRRSHERVMLNLIDQKLIFDKKKPLVKLIDGRRIMKEFKLTPSPLVGKLLSAVREEQSLGNITTKTQAFEFARKCLKKMKK
ncbi:MAG: HD domain-containing protein [Candidatus Omnitrophota bacterium]